MSAGSDYQRLRAHLAFLRMGAAAEALPGLLDEAMKAKLTSRSSSNGSCRSRSTPSTSGAGRA